MNRKKRETLTPYSRQMLLRGILSLLKSHKGHVRCNMRSFVKELATRNAGFPFSNQRFVERTLLELHKAHAIVLLREQPSNPELRQFAGKIVTGIKLTSETAFALVSDDDLADLKARHDTRKAGKVPAKDEPVAAKPPTAKPVAAPSQPKSAKPAKAVAPPKPATAKASAEEDRIMRLSLLMNCLHGCLPLNRHLTSAEILDKLSDSARHFTGIALHLDLISLVAMGLVQMDSRKHTFRWNDEEYPRLPNLLAMMVVLEDFHGSNPAPGTSASRAVITEYRERQILNLVEKWPFGFPCHSALLLPALYQHWGPRVPGNTVRYDIAHLTEKGRLKKIPCRTGDKKFGFLLKRTWGPAGKVASPPAAAIAAPAPVVTPAPVPVAPTPAVVQSSTPQEVTAPTIQRVLLSRAELEAELAKLRPLQSQLEEEHRHAIADLERRSVEEGERINRDFATRTIQTRDRIAAIEKLLPHYDEVAAVIGAPKN